MKPAAGDAYSSTKLYYPENENLAGRRKHPIKYKSSITREIFRGSNISWNFLNFHMTEG